MRNNQGLNCRRASNIPAKKYKCPHCEGVVGWNIKYGGWQCDKTDWHRYTGTPEEIPRYSIEQFLTPIEDGDVKK